VRIEALVRKLERAFQRKTLLRLFNAWGYDVSESFAKEILAEIEMDKNLSVGDAARLAHFVPWSWLSSAAQERVTQKAFDRPYAKIPVVDQIRTFDFQDHTATMCSNGSLRHQKTLGRVAEGDYSVSKEIANEDAVIIRLKVDGQWTPVFSLKLIGQLSLVALKTLRGDDGRIATLRGDAYVPPQWLIRAAEVDYLSLAKYSSPHFVLDVPEGKTLRLQPSGSINDRVEKEGVFDREKFVADAQRVIAQYTEDATGGIDLNATDKLMQVKASGDGVKFSIDPVLLERMRAASGLSPVIINVQPLNDLSQFLGIK
jgi:hypothetical protein